MSETSLAINDTSKRLNSTIKHKEVFDPRILDTTGSGKSLWTSESIELAIKGLSEGYKLTENPYLKSVKGANIRKAHLAFKYTEDEMQVMQLCACDKEFFSDNFGKLKDGDKGWSNITLRPYQRNLLKMYTENRWNIVMFPRQSGKTTTTVLEILHFCCFNIDKDTVVIAQSDRVVNEILAKIKEAFAGLPFFMQPGFVSFNKNGFVLDNGCRLSIGIASESVVQGFSLDLLYIDEFAYIKGSLVKKFWNNVYPTLINNPSSRCIITSTPNGRNFFWELWTGAEAKLNKFKPYRIYWYDVPRAQTLEEFKADTIANVGLEGWEMGFECSFDTQLKSIFRMQQQKMLREIQLGSKDLWSQDNNPFGNHLDMTFIQNSLLGSTHESAIDYDLFNDYFLLGIDIAEGLGQDSTIAKLKKIAWDKNMKKLVYKSVGVFKDNSISVEDFAEWTMNFSKHFDRNKLRIVVENNTYGGEFFGQIKSLQMHDQNHKDFDPIVFAKFLRDSKKDFEYGIRWNGQNKKLAVKSFSNLVNDNTLQESHYLSIEEYLNFGMQKNGTYAAQYGHDDLVMADVSISAYVKSNNIYSNAFLADVMAELRFRMQDEDEEVLKKKAEEKRKEESIYRLDGFEMRDHAKCLSEREQVTDMYLLMM